MRFEDRTILQKLSGLPSPKGPGKAPKPAKAPADQPMLPGFAREPAKAPAKPFWTRVPASVPVPLGKGLPESEFKAPPGVPATGHSDHPLGFVPSSADEARAYAESLRRETVDIHRTRALPDGSLDPRWAGLVQALWKDRSRMKAYLRGELDLGI